MQTKHSTGAAAPTSPVVLTPEEIAVVQRWQATKARKATKAKATLTQPPKAASGGLDGFTVFLLVIVGLLIGWGIVS